MSLPANLLSTYAGKNEQVGFFQAIIPGVSSVVSTSASSAQSAAFQSTSSIVRLAVTQDTWVKFGANPTADKTTSIFMPSGSVEYFGVQPGQKVAALQDSAAGKLIITEGL